jgi:hypothetical protein
MVLCRVDCPWGDILETDCPRPSKEEGRRRRCAVAQQGLLLPEIASFRLDCLRDMPAKFRSQVSQNEPFIGRVSVRSMTDATVRKSEGARETAQI